MKEMVSGYSLVMQQNKTYYMKTAMQELIEIIKFYEEECVDEDIKIGLTSAKNMAKDMLEKEKEQIINFCWECLRGDNIHTITSNKELIEYINNKYNQTYNQNK